VTVESDLPWVPLAVKDLLAADAAFVEAVGATGRIYTRAPASVAAPYVTIQLPTPLGAMGGGGYKPIVQVDAWRVEAGTEDPEIVVWRIAMRAKNVLQVARNVPFETMHWSARVIDCGPLPPDRTRGDDSPLYRAMCRAELTIRNR
jgi:hypothetical protein